MTLRDALRRAADGLPKVGTYTIQAVLKEAGFGWRQTRTWCETGISIRRRQSGERVRVVDIDAEAKKADRTSLQIGEGDEAGSLDTGRKPDHFRRFRCPDKAGGRVARHSVRIMNISGTALQSC